MEADSGGALAAVGEQFDALLDAMPADEKYNAVLSSLLTRGSNEQSRASALELVEEMSTKRITVSAEAFKALVDVAVSEGTPGAILDSLSVASTNGACRVFASPQLRLPSRPPPSALEGLPAVPGDKRGSEVAAAGTLSVSLGAVFAWEVADLIDFADVTEVSAPPLQIVLLTLAAGWAFDRYARSGELSGLVGRGLSRLFSRDLQRECTVESASFLVGYLLGLPCCPFAPTVYKPLEMLTESSAQISSCMGPSARLIDRTLIWLLAPVAVEMATYRETLQAEPALAFEFLEAARRREASLGVDVSQGDWQREDDELRIRWAYGESRRLLQRYASVREELQERMASGVSAGDCVVLIEDRLKNSWASI